MAGLIEAQGIGVTLGGREILAEVAVAVSAGELVGLIGPNGAGKTTLLRVLAGLLRPDRGSVALDGADMRRLTRRSLARRLAYLPQDHAMHWAISVEDLVRLGRLPHRGFGAPFRDADRRATARALATMDVAQFARRPVTELSGGERTRALIARTLAQNPAVLLADEPVAGLDAVHQLELFAHLRRLADAERAVVVVLHDLSMAARFCDRLVVMASGRVRAVGPAAEVLTAETLQDVYGITAHLGAVDGVPFIVPLESLAGGRG